MTDEQKITGLIPAKALGCLNSEDSLTIQSFIDQGLTFPWDELGKYQYIASLLPLALQLEIPEPQLKDNVALKLIKLSEELRTKKIHEEEELLALNKTEEEIDSFSDNNVLPEDLTENQTPVEDNEIITSFNLDEIDLPEADAPEPFILPATEELDQGPTDFSSEEIPEKTFSLEETDQSQETTILEEPMPSEFSEESPITNSEVDELSVYNLAEEKLNEDKADGEKEFINDLAPQAEEKKAVENISDSAKFVETQKKTLNEKIYKALEQDFESLKFSFDESERKLTRNLLMAYVAIAILLALLIFSYFKFTSDIKAIENEVKDMKQKITSELIDQKIFNSDFDFHS